MHEAVKLKLNDFFKYFFFIQDRLKMFNGMLSRICVLWVNLLQQKDKYVRSFLS